MKLAMTKIIRKTTASALLVAFLFSNVLIAGTFAANGVSITTKAGLTTDLTQLGREGRLRESLSFEGEVNRVIEVLEKGGSRQPLIVDETGSVQDEIVEQVAIRMVRFRRN
jgi:ATP-dependent Clp protease ATP-binding subunit ClpA